MKSRDQKLLEQIIEEEFETIQECTEAEDENDPNAACYEVIAVWMYGYSEYQEKIQAVTNINYLRPEYHRSMLHEAVSTRKLEIALDLIQRGIDLNIQDYNGNTALHYAVGNLKYRENRMIAKAILDRRPRVNLQDHDGNTALWYVLYHARNVAGEEYDECCEIVKMLLDAGADTNLKNRLGSSPAKAWGQVLSRILQEENEGLFL